MITVTILEPPLAVDTPRGKADAMAMIDYSQMDYFYFRVALRGSGEFWDVRSDQVRLRFDESSGRGHKSDDDPSSSYCVESANLTADYQRGYNDGVRVGVSIARTED